MAKSIMNKRGFTPLEKAADFRKLRSLTGLTLFEILVATIILALTITGLVNIFVSVKRFTLNSQLRMSGGEVGRYQLSRFSDAVRQDQWDNSANDYQSGNMLRKTSSLVTGVFGLSSSPYPNRQYTTTYKVGVPAGFAPTSPLRKVKVTLTWTE